MKHLSVFRRWTSTARQLWLALLGLVLLFVTLVFSTLDFTLQLNRYTIASSQDCLQNTARSSIAALNSYLEQQMSYVQRAATAIASLPAGSSEEDVRQLLDEYFQRSDFAQMWAVSLDKQAISSQRLRRAERLFRRVQQPIYKDDRFYVYVPVRVNPEQPVTGAVLGVLKVEQGAAPDLADRFVRMAREKGVPCSRLAFELTKSRSLRGTDGVPLLIRQLFAAGAAITVDGFGAGHSNLTRILDLPEAEAVKLDRYVMRTCLTRDPKLGGGLSAGLLLRHAHGCRRAVPVSASRSALSVHLPLFCPAFCVAKRGKIL